MRNRVEVNGIRVYAYHGCMKEETALGGKFKVDVAVETNFSKSAHSDKLSDTIDYAIVKTIVVDEMAIPSKLIEHVGYRISNRLKKSFPSVVRSCVKVSKLNAPIDGYVDEVAIVIEEEYKEDTPCNDEEH